MDSVFNEMMAQNQQVLEANGNPDGYQAVTVLTSDGALHTLFGLAHDGVDRLSQELMALLSENNTPVVTALVCQWANGGVDLPHIALRKALLHLDSRNEGTQILLHCAEGCNIRLLKETF